MAAIYGSIFYSNYRNILYSNLTERLQLRMRETFQRENDFLIVLQFSNGVHRTSSLLGGNLLFYNKFE